MRRVVSGDLDTGDNDYTNGTMFRQLPPLPVMENSRPTETSKRDLDTGDNDYTNGTMFRQLPPLPVMENSRPTETSKTESCFQKNWSIRLKVSLLGVIALLFILLIIVCAHFSAASVRVEEEKNSNMMKQFTDSYPEYFFSETVICPVPWKRRGDSCYFLSYVIENWQDAMNSCARQESKLLILTNKEEMDFLVTLMDGKPYWIGLLKNQFSTWTWVDGTPLTFRNWSPNEPNNAGGNELCVEMKPNGWNDVSCDLKLPYICMK